MPKHRTRKSRPLARPVRIGLLVLAGLAMAVAVTFGAKAFMEAPTKTATEQAGRQSIPPAKRRADKKQQKPVDMPSSDKTLDELKKKLELYLATVQGEVGIYLSRDDGSGLEINGSKTFRSASLIKIPVAIGAYSEMNAGRLRLDEQLVVPAVTGEFGGQSLPPGSRATVDTLLELMLAKSDNAAANALIDRVGMETVNRVAVENGAAGTYLERKMLDMVALEAGIDNESTPADMALFLRSLKNKAILTPADCEAILSKLALNGDKEMIASLTDAEVVHKTGVMTSPTGYSVGDAAIVGAGGESFVLVVMAQDQPDEATGIKHIENIARMIKDDLLAARAASKGWKVFVDPGHQQRGNPGKEPVGPGSSETKDKVSGGATGASTGIPEYELTLALANKVAEGLRREGVEVSMSRTTNDADVSNKERAEAANAFDSDLFLRLHADSSNDASATGFSVLRPAKNEWTEGIHDASLEAADKVYAALLADTGRPGRGVVSRGDLAGFNWSKVPSILVETGFLSNPDEDALLNSPEYQDKLAQAIVRGVIEYLQGR
ncbi:MAG: serine hydrolase [Candidatus Aquicultorales bacterium]